MKFFFLEARISVWLARPVQLPKSHAEYYCQRNSGVLYVPRAQPKQGEFKRLYQTLGLSFDQRVHLGLTQIGFTNFDGIRVPVLKDDLGLKVPQWINRFSRQLFSRSYKYEYLPYVVLKGGKMFLISRNTNAYAVCVSLPEGFKII